jgi:hypothetical protein
LELFVVTDETVTDGTATAETVTDETVRSGAFNGPAAITDTEGGLLANMAARVAGRMENASSESG